MNLQFAFICDDAREDASGKLDARGIFHDLYAPGFPAMQEAMTLVLVVEWGREDQGRHALKAELVSPDGTTILTVDGHSDVDPRPRDRPPGRTRLVMPLKEVVFPEPGRYDLQVTVKGKKLSGPSLYLLPTGDEEGGA